MLDKILRSPKEKVLGSLTHLPLQFIHPTTITSIGLGCGLVAGITISQGWYVWGLSLWVVNRILDGLDGTIARLYNKQSDLGAYLDILADFVVYAVIPLSLALSLDSSIDASAVYLSLAFLFACFYINSASWMYLSALLEKRQQGAIAQGELTTITMPGGLIEGTETILFYCLFLLFPHALVIEFVLMGICVLITACQRLIWALKHLAQSA